MHSHTSAPSVVAAVVTSVVSAVVTARVATVKVAHRVVSLSVAKADVSAVKVAVAHVVTKAQLHHVAVMHKR